MQEEVWKPGEPEELELDKEVIVNGWKLNPVMGFMMLESFCPLD